MLTDVLSNWKLDDAWLAYAKNLALGKELVTLDIFDTALTRDVDSPIDIFAKIEKTLDERGLAAEGYAQARIEAEEKARRQAHNLHGFEEITFEEIHAQLATLLSLPPQHLRLARDLEIQIEAESLFAVPDILNLTRILNKESFPFAFVSDMYLGKDILSGFLKKAGYQGWHSVIVSCDVRKTKFSGSIWNIEPLKSKKILHIGDHPHSDVAMPRQYGQIETLLYDRARSHTRVLNFITPPHILPFSKQKRYTEMECRRDPLPTSIL